MISTDRGARRSFATEIEMLVKPEHHELPLYDTTLIHARENHRLVAPGGCRRA